jgi:hypothetical protein
LAIAVASALGVPALIIWVRVKLSRAIEDGQQPTERDRAFIEEAVAALSGHVEAITAIRRNMWRDSKWSSRWNVEYRGRSGDNKVARCKTGGFGLRWLDGEGFPGQSHLRRRDRLTGVALALLGGSAVFVVLWLERGSVVDLVLCAVLAGMGFWLLNRNWQGFRP